MRPAGRTYPVDEPSWSCRFPWNAWNRGGGERGSVIGRCDHRKQTSKQTQNGSNNENTQTNHKGTAHYKRRRHTNTDTHTHRHGHTQAHLLWCPCFLSECAALFTAEMFLKLASFKLLCKLYSRILLHSLHHTPLPFWLWPLLAPLSLIVGVDNQTNKRKQTNKQKRKRTLPN
jgi:hypothetical protein